MLAYRHAFHAGNHADVLKHTTLVAVLRHMNLKDKAYRVVDTHAGAGGYSLQSEYAHKRGEYEHGIARLWGRDDLPAPVADMVGLVRDFNGGKELRQYPGSPAFAHMLLRPQDQLRLFEIHPTDHKILASYLGEQPNVEIKMSDGFTGLTPQLPPPSRRGVVLIDPSYELKSDYAKTLAALREVLTLFAECTVIVWLPQLQLLEAAQLPQRLKASAETLAKKGWLHAQLTLSQADARGFGLLGSSIFVANPPHTLHDKLKDSLPWLTTTLAQFDGARHRLERGGGA
ncbi:MAG: 23S rRNA (adenine(2030)-N(6))-methyltransferase RlmJ [Rubrivivax sp.]|nr:23S rRNA (adenine(2030)-N(6))-methyltransferase RlmJ [Rubrivivax sp.]